MPSRVRVESVRPPSERAPGYEKDGTVAPFGAGSGSPTAPVPGVVSIPLRPNVGDELTTDGGSVATLIEIDTLNAAFKGKAWSFPGTAGDDNNVQWCNLPVPINLAAEPALRVRVHLIVVS